MSHCGLKASNYSYETLRELLPATNTVWEKQNFQHRLLIDLQIKWREIGVKQLNQRARLPAIVSCIASFPGWKRKDPGNEVVSHLANYAVSNADREVEVLCNILVDYFLNSHHLFVGQYIHSMMRNYMLISFKSLFTITRLRLLPACS